MYRALLLFLLMQLSPSRQTDPFEGKLNCAVGAGYAAIVAGGASEPLAAFTERFPVEFRNGDSEVPMRVLCSVLRSASQSATAVQIESRQLKESHLPCIILVHLTRAESADKVVGHYLFVDGIYNGGITVVDPADLRSRYTIDAEQLARIWAGHAILLNEQTGFAWAGITCFVCLCAARQVAMYLRDRRYSFS